MDGWIADVQHSVPKPNLIMGRRWQQELVDRTKAGTVDQDWQFPVSPIYYVMKYQHWDEETDPPFTQP